MLCVRTVVEKPAGFVSSFVEKKEAAAWIEADISKEGYGACSTG